MVNQHEFKHYTNGIKNIFINPNIGIPEGFYPGITRRKKIRKLPGNGGKKHFTNGIKNIFCFPADCPPGFKAGITVWKPRAITKISAKTKKLLDNINQEEFKHYFHNNSNKRCAEKFHISEFQVNTIASYLDEERTSIELDLIKKQALADKRIKTEKTCLERFGTKSPAESQIVKSKLADTQLKKYGMPLTGGAVSLITSDYSDEFKALAFDEKASTDFMNNHNKEFFRKDLMNRFNCPSYALDNWIYKFGLAGNFKYAPSHYEDEIADLYPQINFIRHYRGEELDGKEIDLYDPIRKIGIEFNGTHWHSTLNISDKYYHQNKSKKAESAGIRLIHIYEYEWINPEMQRKIILMLNICFGTNITKIYARNCIIKEIDNSEAKKLNNEIHLQNHRNAQITLGLYYKDKLVQLMSFSKTKYNRNLKSDNSWEIIRGCPGSNNIVVGGVSKLFKYFIQKYNPDEIFSYCDFNKFNGKSYERLGMKFVGYTVPDLKYVLKGDKVINRNPTKYIQNKENAVAKIFGAGSKKYIWKKLLAE